MNLFLILFSLGYCVAGTVGHKILNGTRKIEFKKGKPVDVKMSVQVNI